MAIVFVDPNLRWVPLEGAHLSTSILVPTDAGTLAIMPDTSISISGILVVIVVLDVASPVDKPLHVSRH